MPNIPVGIGGGVVPKKGRRRRRKPPRSASVTFNSPPPIQKPPAADPVQQQLNADLALLDAWYRRSQQDFDQRAQQQRSIYAALAQELAPIAGNIEGIVGRQNQATTGFAKGFSDAMAQLANQSAAAGSADIAQMGMPGSIAPQGQAQGNALYGEFGYIPAQAFGNYGAAQAAAAAMLPGTARLQGEQQIGRLQTQFQSETLRDLDMERLKLLSSLPQRRAEYRESQQEKRDRARAETLDLYKSGLLTQRQFAKRMGVKNWRKFPNVLLGDESAVELREVGGGLYAIDLKRGKITTLIPGEGPEPEIRTSGGYIWERDPQTGQWAAVGGTGPKPDKPSNYQTKTIGGRTWVFDPNTGIFYDPKTGRPGIPRGTSGKGRSKFTPSQVQDFRGQSHSLAQDFREGIPAEQTDDGIEIPPRPYGEAVQAGLREGIPLNILIPILNRYYPPGIGGRPVNSGRLRGYQEGAGRGSGKGKPASGGRANASFSGSESLVGNAVPLMGYALSQGFTNLGTHNPASRLPSGGISDHAKYPAEAFDIGGFGGGYRNAKARRMFAWLIRQPGVKYVILGDKIWSRERGLHAYTSGGHDTHIHVSVYPGTEL